MTGKPVRAFTRALLGAFLAIAIIGATAGPVLARHHPTNPATNGQRSVPIVEGRQAGWFAGRAHAVKPRSRPVAAVPRSASDCGSQVICLWGHQGFDGQIFIVANQTNGWDSLAGTFNDRARSFVNNKAVDARLAENSDGSGDHHCLPAGTQQSTMGSFNGEASAINVYGSNAVCNN